MNKDFEIFARDSLTVNQPELREMITVNFQNPQGDLTTQEDIANYNKKSQEIFNTLRKLRREASGFLNARDQELMKDFMKNMRGYLRHIEVYELVKGFYDKKQREIHDR